MELLVKGNAIYAMAENISFGVFENEEKWKLIGEDGRLLYYIIDNGYELVENVTLPDDYVEGKFFYENGEFVLNAEWKPYVSAEERIANLEAENAELRKNMEMQAEVLDFLIMQ